MELRSRTIVRLDRLRARLHSHFPAWMQPRFAIELDAAFRERHSKPDFMGFLDSFQKQLYSRLLETYRHEPFSQLLTLKLCNLAASKFHFLNRHSVLVSKPYQLTVDPANACQLACPGCVHSSNAAYREPFDWPRNTLAVEQYESFIRETGPYAFCAELYNYGEPLLNKRFPEFVRASKKYLLFTMTSTNLSMPLKDPESIVTSGLDRAILSIDGTTQDAYQKYRKNGDLGLVFENVRKLVAAKRKLGSSKPYLVWQFLTFEHNAHQVDEAIRKAKELGVNEIVVATPFRVDHDDPSVRAVTVKQQGAYKFEKSTGAADHNGLADIGEEIQSQFNKSWQERLSETGTADEPASDHATCDWLYQNITLDGAGRLMPCCMAPGNSVKPLVFAHFDPSQDSVNSSMAKLARLSFANRAAYDQQTRHLPSKEKPYCADCTEAPKPYGLANVAADIRTLDGLGAIPHSLKWRLTNWDG